MRSRIADSLQAIFVACSVLCFLTGAATRPQQETTEQSAARVKKAIQYDESGRAKNGIGHALDVKPKGAEAHFIDAQVYWREGARWMAMEALEKAIENQPVYPEAYLLLAQCLADDDKPDKAREQVNIAIAQGISGFPAYRLLAAIDLAKEDFVAAISSLETALRYATTIDDEEANKVRDQLVGLREFTRQFARFADLRENQKAPDIVRPVLIDFVGPRYTEEARALKIQGSVALVLLITENGDVDTVLPYRSLGHGLDEQAVEAARKLKFSPATQSGKPIRYLTRLSMEFNLR
jgi:TonB family protein